MLLFITLSDVSMQTPIEQKKVFAQAFKTSIIQSISSQFKCLSALISAC